MKFIEHVRRFLDCLWLPYVSSKDLWCEIRLINDYAKSYWFKWSPNIAEEVCEWIRKNWNELEKVNVYFGVLPRSNFKRRELDNKGKPRVSGRGYHIERGLFIFADLDFKEEIDINVLPREIRQALDGRGYYVIREDEDGGLEGYFKKYSARGRHRVEYVKKPGLKDFIESIKPRLEKLGIGEPSIIVDSGYGYHIYVKLSYEVSIKQWKKLQSMFINYLGGDPKTKDPSRVLRLPDTLNNRYYPHYARWCRLAYMGAAVLNEIDPKKLEDKLEELLNITNTANPVTISTTASTGRFKFRILKPDEISRAVDILKKYYIIGHRQFLWLYISGWGARSKIHPSSILLLLYRLYQDCDDEDPIETRCSTIVYTYCLLYTSPSPRDLSTSRMPSSA